MMALIMPNFENIQALAKTYDLCINGHTENTQVNNRNVSKCVCKPCHVHITENWCVFECANGGIELDMENKTDKLPQCKCNPYRWTGRCCRNMTCSDFGTKTKTDEGREYCKCRNRTRGAHCEFYRCSNGGKTKPDGGCECGKFTGPTCLDKNCFNDAKLDQVRSNCICKPGFYGDHCEFISCENRGKPMIKQNPVMHQYGCQCTHLSTGEFCQNYNTTALALSISLGLIVVGLLVLLIWFLVRFCKRKRERMINAEDEELFDEEESSNEIEHDQSDHTLDRKESDQTGSPGDTMNTGNTSEMLNRPFRRILSLGRKVSQARVKKSVDNEHDSSIANQYQQSIPGSKLVIKHNMNDGMDSASSK